MRPGRFCLERFGPEHDPGHQGSRRFVIAAVAAALLGGTALLCVSPVPASAAAHPCGSGEFCLYFNKDANGGYCHFGGGRPAARRRGAPETDAS
jgi:hypothetical protein